MCLLKISYLQSQVSCFLEESPTWHKACILNFHIKATYLVPDIELCFNFFIFGLVIFSQQTKSTTAQKIQHDVDCNLCLCEARHGCFSLIWVHEVHENEANVKHFRQENNFSYPWRVATQPHFNLTILLITDSYLHTVGEETLEHL